MREPSDISKDIEETHARIGELAEAVASKADIGAHAEDLVSDTKDSLRATADAVIPDAWVPTGETVSGSAAAVRRAVYVAVGAVTVGVRLAARVGERALGRAKTP